MPFKIPKGWRLLEDGEEILVCFNDDEDIQDWEEFEFDPTEDPTIVESASFPVIRLSNKYLETVRKNSHPVSEVLKKDTDSSVEPPTKEEVKMAAPASFFAQMKASAVHAGKTAASTTLAEKITELVIARLPKKVQSLCKIAPAPLRVFLISTAVFAAASRFDIPGRDRVRDISKYAVDGSMHEAFRLVSKILEPVFQAIREMAPDDLKGIMDEAKGSSDLSDTVA